MDPESTDAVLKANGDFSARLHRKLSPKRANLVFSPISAHVILSLCYQGAAGATAESFARVLNLPGAEVAARGWKSATEALKLAENVALHMANKLYVMDGFEMRERFAEVAVESFYAEVEGVDFCDATEAARTINAWVESRTNGKIRNLLQPEMFKCYTRMVLVNAIYFKGKWSDKFRECDTRKEQFYVNGCDKVEVDMMHATRWYNYKEDDNLGAKILEMPYCGANISMIIILPNETDGLATLEMKLVSADLTVPPNNFRGSFVELSLPRFKIESTIDLKGVLQELGLAVAFSNDANFSRLLESTEAICMSNVIQKAIIEVNEEGTEAAAATAVRQKRIICKKRAPPVKEFKADHPFLFLLVQKGEGRDTILFQGKLTAP